MDKKKILKDSPPEDLLGFEEFIQSHSDHPVTNQRPKDLVKDANFEHFDFLMNDSERLARLRSVLTEKLPFCASFAQGARLIEKQRQEIDELRAELFKICDAPGSSFRKSFGEIFDGFFEPPRTR